MPGLGALWDSLVDCICRPPRDEYSYPDELVGGSRKLFRVGRCPGIREDLTLVNKRGLRLQCSHYLPRHVRGKDGRLPCVIYCHCNSGSRRDAEEAICVLIPQGVSVFTLDFAGSGLSEGQWVTLGAEEVDDVGCAVEHLRAGGKVSTLGLWGRSMGAVTALLYSQRDPSIAGMVLDSPFSRLTDLMLEIVQEQRLPIPRPLAKLALAAMRRSVMKRAGFDITKVSPLDAVSQSFIPALFGHATGDTFIRISHAEALHTAYAGDKNLIRFDGDHNSRRPEFFYNSVSIFWHNTLQLEQLLEPADLQNFMANQAAAVAAAAAGSGARGPPRSLRPPPPSQLQPRVRQPLSPLPVTAPAGASAAGGAAAPAAGGGAAAAAGTAATPGGGGNGGFGRSSSESETASAAGAGRPAAAAAAATGNLAEWRDGDEDGADLAAPVRAAARSAPWEPRLWELDLDKTLMERQRFRRMAGGLPSPPGGASAAASGASGAAAGGGGGVFRNSEELRHLLANASDDSVIARLLGEDAQMSDAQGGAAAAAGRGGGAAAGPGLAASAAGLWLPSSMEEEEAQLQAALELSLLELQAEQVARGADLPTSQVVGSGGGPGAPVRQPAQQGSVAVPAAGRAGSVASGDGSSVRTSPVGTAGMAALNTAAPAGPGPSQRPQSGLLLPLHLPALYPTHAVSEQVSQGQARESPPTQPRHVGPAEQGLRSSGLQPAAQAPPQRASTGPLGAGGQGQVGSSSVPSGPVSSGSGSGMTGQGPMAAAATTGVRMSLMFPMAPAPATTAGGASGAGSSPANGLLPAPAAAPLHDGGSLSHEEARAPGAASRGASPPTLGALSGPQSPSQATTYASTAAADVGATTSTLTRGSQDPRAGPLGSGAATPAGAGGPVGAIVVGNAAGAGGNVGRALAPNGTADPAAVGPSVYDVYSEDELLALAVRLSLQESAAS